jgi:hypothetical protein
MADLNQDRLWASKRLMLGIIGIDVRVELPVFQNGFTFKWKLDAST